MIFLDSSFLVSFEVAADSNHEKSVGIMNEIVKGKFGRAVVSDYIFDETVTVTFRRTKSLRRAISTGNGIFDSYLIEKVDEIIFNQAWDFFRRQDETKLSFTDCTNIFVMRENGIKNIATFDEDFKKIKGINVIC